METMEDLSRRELIVKEPTESVLVDDYEEMYDYEESLNKGEDIGSKPKPRLNPRSLGVPSGRLRLNIFSVTQLYLAKLDKESAIFFVELYGRRLLHTQFILYATDEEGTLAVSTHHTNDFKDITSEFDGIFAEGRNVTTKDNTHRVTLEERFIRSAEFNEFIIKEALRMVHNVTPGWYPMYMNKHTKVGLSVRTSYFGE